MWFLIKFLFEWIFIFINTLFWDWVTKDYYITLHYIIYTAYPWIVVGAAGANPRWHWLRGGAKPGQVASVSQGQTKQKSIAWNNQEYYL